MIPACDVSFILAAFNERPTLPSIVRDVRARFASAEIVVVDDGSTDGTGVDVPRDGLVWLRHETNRGKGAAIRTGLSAATRRVVVFMDVDGQDPVAEVPLLLDAVEGGADLAIGSKFVGSRQPGALTPVNAIGNVALSTVLNRLYGSRLTDSQSGFKAGVREKLARLQLSADRYDIEVQVLAQALKKGLRVVDVPVTRAARTAGVSKLSPIRHGTRILARILWERLLP